MSFAVTASECTIHSFIFNCFIHARILYWTCVHYIEVFLNIGTKKSVHCSELGGVHYIEVNLQQKLIGGTGTCVQTRGVHYKRFYCIFESGNEYINFASRKFLIATSTDPYLNPNTTKISLLQILPPKSKFKFKPNQSLN